MSFSYSFKQKGKVALLLFCVMSCLMLIRVLEDQNMQKISQSFQSMYKDRLVPATDLFEISEKIHEKKRLIETGDFKNLSSLDIEIDCLIIKYQGTFLINKEIQQLANFNALVDESRNLEQSLSINKANLIQLNLVYNKLSLQLIKLMRLQTEVGQDLVKKSDDILIGSKFYSMIQYGLAIIIGILIISIISASNVIRHHQKNFRLN